MSSLAHNWARGKSHQRAAAGGETADHHKGPSRARRRSGRGRRRVRRTNARNAAVGRGASCEPRVSAAASSVQLAGKVTDAAADHGAAGACTAAHAAAARERWLCQCRVLAHRVLGSRHLPHHAGQAAVKGGHTAKLESADYPTRVFARHSEPPALPPARTAKKKKKKGRGRVRRRQATAGEEGSGAVWGEHLCRVHQRTNWRGRCA